MVHRIQVSLYGVVAIRRRFQSCPNEIWLVIFFLHSSEHVSEMQSG